MAQCFTDFSSYTTDGSIPSDWEVVPGRGDEANWEVQSDGNALGGRKLVNTGGDINAQEVIYWDGVSDSGGNKNVELLARVIDDNGVTDGTSARLVAREQTTSDRNLIFGEGDGATDETRIAGYVGGNFNPLNSDTKVSAVPYYIRLRVNGINPIVIKIKTWTGSVDDEPSSYIEDTLDISDLEEAGEFGFGRGDSDFAIDWMSVGTNGDTAPFLQAPSGLVVTDSSVQGEITLDWTNNGGNRFYIYRATSSGASKSDYTQVADVASPPYTDTGLEDGERYYYRVSAYT